MKCLVLASLLLIPAAAWAQTLDPDEEGCKDSAVVTRMPGCRISECKSKDFDATDVIVGPGKDDELATKNLEGKTEVLTFECPANVSLIQIVRNVEAAMRKAGFQTVFSGRGGGANDPTVTGRNGAQWVEVKTWDNGGPFYTQTAVTVQEMEQQVTASAESWAAEIEKTGRVSVYGINFDTGKATIRPDSEAALQEIVTLLNNEPEWKLRVEGHTDSAGTPAANQALSQQRAAAVAGWLAGKGVDKARLSAQGFGDSKPVADNSTDAGKAKNRRVELVKM